VTAPRVRAAAVADAAAVLELWRVADAVPSATDDRAGLELLLARAPDGLLVAEADDGTVIGSVIAVFDGWRANLYRLAVHPAHRRRGIATALVSDAERRLRAAGCRRASALVMHDHDDAVGCWAALGYEQDRRVDRYVKTL
jgi:ribosomal protein S18 acetylase RimI-like enzyme